MGGSIAIDPAKTKAIVTWPKHTYVKDIQQFEGLVNYCNEFITQFVQIAALLADLLSSKWYDWEQTVQHQLCFKTLLSTLHKTPVLKMPDFDKPFVVEPDASDLTIIVEPLQKNDDQLYSIV